jgi:hypothetical protein
MNWGINLIIIEGDGTMHMITITKHLDNNTKQLEVPLYFVNDEKKIVIWK